MACEEINMTLKEIEETMSKDTFNNKTPASKDFNIPTTPSSLHNKFDITYAALQEDKHYIENKLKLVAKAQRIVDLLSYRTYEIRYNFYNELEQLESRLDELKATGPSTTMSASLLSLKVVEIEDVIEKRADQFLKDDKSIKNILIKAQDYHEKCIDRLDKTLDSMKNRLETLQLVAEASKMQATNNIIDLNAKLLADIEACMENFMQLQTQDWRIQQQQSGIQESSFFSNQKLSITPKGLIVTTSGRTLNYHEVRESNLLDGINIFNFDVDLDDATNTTGEEDQQKKFERNAQAYQSSTSNTNSSRSSTKKTSELNVTCTNDDLNYIKDTLGVPLTLALAEITARQPKDPIHYLGHWLFKYRYNQQIKLQDNIAMEQLKIMRAQLAERKWKEMLQMEIRDVIIEMIVKAEEQAYHREMERIEKEQAAAEELIDQALEEEAKDKFDTYDTGLAI